MKKVFIGLGSNLGECYINLTRAKELLIKENIKIIKESSITETDPVDFLEQPRFLNQIILVQTSLSPENLLKVLNKIEKNLGRKKVIPKGPRIIDLDILLYANNIINEKNLIIPHPAIKERKFILKHLIELEPDLKNPEDGELYREVYNGKKI